MIYKSGSPGVVVAVGGIESKNNEKVRARVDELGWRERKLNGVWVS